jgi:uncharacterized protein YdcH (DUF465 family)
MERNAQDEIRAHLMATNEEFQKLASRHCEYSKQLDSLEAQAHLTEHEQIEETRIKKLKLHLKDQMEAMILEHKHHQVA